MTEHALPKRRYLALWLPFLSADRLKASGAAAADAALVMVEKQRGALRIAALSPVAAELGLARGMSLADARAREPDLIAIPDDPIADRSWLERAADACDHYTPMVALDPPDTILLDVTGCLHLFPGEAEMAADLRRTLARLDIRHAFADTPEAAWALARYATHTGIDEKTGVRCLPLAALRVDPTAEAALRRAGLKTVGDLADRPTAPLSARFGSGVALMLDRMLGRSDSRITPRRPLPALVVERRFAEPLAHIDAALAVIEELLAEAGKTMSEQGKGGRRFAVRFYRSDGVTSDLAVETGQPRRDPRVIMRLFRERIEVLADPLDPGFGFDLIRLAVPVLEPLLPEQETFEKPIDCGDALTPLIERLTARLGRERVSRFAPCNTHIPERAAHLLPACEAGGTEWPALAPGEPPLRPQHLLDPPQPVEVIAEVPDGPPRRFRWKGTLHEIQCHEGPERIAGEWWRGGKRPTRDYYRVEDTAGRRFWLFRHGLYVQGRDIPRWYVHGLFA